MIRYLDRLPRVGDKLYMDYPGGGWGPKNYILVTEVSDTNIRGDMIGFEGTFKGSYKIRSSHSWIIIGGASNLPTDDI